MVLPFLLSALSGFLTKSADEIKTPLGLAAGAAYGASLAVASALNPLIAVVFVPSVLANLVAGKIDSRTHALGLAGFILGLLALGLPALVLPLAALAFAAALADELIEFNLPYPRPLLPAAAALISYFTASFTPILAVLLFDAGYVLAQETWKTPAPAAAATKKPKKKR